MSYCFDYICTITYKFPVPLWVTYLQQLLQQEQIIKESCRLHWGNGLQKSLRFSTNESW